MSDLTLKQQLWLEAYLTTFNATEAARRAGYAGGEGALATAGWENRRNPKIKAAIEARLAEAAVPACETLAMVATIAKGDMQDFLQIDGDAVTVDLEKAARLGKMGLLKKYKPGKHGAEIELYDRLEALALLCKAAGVFREQPERSGPITLQVVYGNRSQAEKPEPENPADNQAFATEESTTEGAALLGARLIDVPNDV